MTNAGSYIFSKYGYVNAFNDIYSKLGLKWGARALQSK